MIRSLILTTMLALLPLVAAAQHQTAQVAQAGQATVTSRAALFSQTSQPVPAVSETVPDIGRPWTLAECIEWARTNNIQLLRQELSTEDAKLTLGNAKLDYLPSLGAGASYNTTFAESFDPVSSTTQGSYSSFSASASLSADVFGGLAKLHTLRRAELSLRETLMTIEKAGNDLALNVTAAYLEVLYAEERVAISEAQMTTLDLQVENTKKLVDAGKSTYSDLLQLQSQAADVRQQLLQNRNNRTMAYFTLCQMLEIEDFENFSIVTPSNIVIPADAGFYSANDIIEAAQSLPQMEVARLGVEIAERDIKIARSARWPSVSFSAGYGSSYSNNQSRQIPDPNNPTGYIYENYPFRDQMRDHATPSISLSLSIPIFNRFQIRNTVRARKIALSRADYDLMLAEKQISSDVRQALIDARGSLEQYNAALANVETTQESFRIVEQRFNLGAATPVDYSIALYNLTNSQSQLSQAKFQYLFKSKILDFYKGIPIELY